MSQTAAGNPAPLGATPGQTGTNFSLYASEAVGVDLLLYEYENAPHPHRTITLDRAHNRTGPYWHIFVGEIGHGQVYAWRVRGPHQPALGHRFDSDKVLLDPYGRAVVNLANYDRKAAKARGDNGPRALRNAVVDNTRYDWQGDHPLSQPEGREFIYEMHLAGFTKSPHSGLPDHQRGTYAGLVAKIPYLKELGVTAVELLPVQQYDPQDAPAGKTNFWGYSTISFFSPHSTYSSDRSACGPVDEFRDMVKALHQASIRVILDVVYNHTAEGGTDGPTLSFRGLANQAYYLLQEDPSKYADYSGCGNSINANHPVTQRMILDSLRYWVQEMHVDGFRFDLASALTRDQKGQADQQAPVIWAIDTDPQLINSQLIAEAWDAGGLYQVGSFPGDRFDQWNGPFRDDVRRFVRGDQGMIESMMARIVGSPDIFSRTKDKPAGSINFITCHDGFSLADLVAYEKKHNLANGEENRDGSDNNHSCNHGHEGPTDDPGILALRQKQVKNFLCLLFLSQGTPMLWMGDEIRQSRQGNNNPWCQDNELNWLDWERVASQGDILRFTKLLAQLTTNLAPYALDKFWAATNPDQKGDLSWHGTELGKPDWKPESRQLAFTIHQNREEPLLHVILNQSDADTDFAIPELPSLWSWHLVLDTAQEPGRDICVPDNAPLNGNVGVTAKNKSTVVLLAKPSTQ